MIQCQTCADSEDPCVNDTCDFIQYSVSMHEKANRLLKIRITELLIKYTKPKSLFSSYLNAMTKCMSWTSDCSAGQADRKSVV